MTQEDYNNGVYSDYLYASSTELGTKHTISFSNLLEYTKYYYKPFCVVNGLIQYGTEDSIKTLAPSGVTIGPAGGYVIYDNGAGGGIEMALEDVMTIDEYGYEDYTFSWGCEGINILGLNSSVGSGESNTALILQSCAELQTASSMCNTFEYNGFTDWHLPSRDELFLIRDDFALLGFGNLSTNDYWCSNQADSYYADFIDMYSSNNSWFSTTKSSQKRVRAVRTF